MSLRSWLGLGVAFGLELEGEGCELDGLSAGWAFWLLSEDAPMPGGGGALPLRSDGFWLSGEFALVCGGDFEVFCCGLDRNLSQSMRLFGVGFSALAIAGSWLGVSGSFGVWGVSDFDSGSTIRIRMGWEEARWGSSFWLVGLW